MSTPDHLTHLHISHALGTRSTRVAVLIVELLQLGRELLEEQPSAVVEALIYHWEERRRAQNEPALRAVHDAVLAYSKHLLQVARVRERQLLHGITGMDYEERPGVQIIPPKRGRPKEP